ncbi:hypothetical protein NP233_g1969 [Leucocoprinus birnbaumii]|uniref:Uncharacterized protein n=1 Tax=Leucocoprinus birnbaumii TaxID=56174 RepID=A0AAD5YVB1_9AGAR|nr:hypothetical protein NP233_g1969 [Leucocoprinus birnbaumii]
MELEFSSSNLPAHPGPVLGRNWLSALPVEDLSNSFLTSRGELIDFWSLITASNQAHSSSTVCVCCTSL